MDATTTTCPSCSHTQDTAPEATLAVCAQCGVRYVIVTCSRCAVVQSLQEGTSRFSCANCRTAQRTRRVDASSAGSALMQLGCGLTILVWVVVPIILVVLFFLLD